MKPFHLYTLFVAVLFINCNNSDIQDIEELDNEKSEFSSESSSFKTTNSDFYYGADLSFVNEMEDCGAIYKDINGVTKDTYTIFSEAGSNLIRVRLFNDPWVSNYSGLADVQKSILRAKTLGMKVLLDFHYSDNFADPGHQKIPGAWWNQFNDQQALGILLYDYTTSVLSQLNTAGALPDIVQIGNETNGNILQQQDVTEPTDWARNIYLLNQGIRAVRYFSSEIEVMLHIANPSVAAWWLTQAKSEDHKIDDFDWIGLSYYPKLHELPLWNLQGVLQTIKNENSSKRLMIVETAYAFTDQWNDQVANRYSNSASYTWQGTSQQGQYDYLVDLKNIVANAGGQGVVYWEPAFVTTGCLSQWDATNPGSTWENNALFDFQNEATLGMNFYALSGNSTNTFECKNLRVVGAATPNGWNFPGIWMGCNNGVVKSSKFWIKQGSFRFFTENNNWDSGLGYFYFQDKGYTIDSKLSSAAEGNDFWFNGTDGEYLIDINTWNKTIYVY